MSHGLLSPAEMVLARMMKALALTSEKETSVFREHPAESPHLLLQNVTLAHFCLSRGSPVAQPWKCLGPAQYVVPELHSGRQRGRVGDWEG